MKIFISYSHSDQQKIDSLVAFLKSKGHQPWFDRGLKPGVDPRSREGSAWKEQIIFNIKQSEVFLYALSPASVASEWCDWEYTSAVQFRKYTIFVLLEKNFHLPPKLEQFQHIDFSNGLTTTASETLLATLKQARKFRVDPRLIAAFGILAIILVLLFNALPEATRISILMGPSATSTHTPEPTATVTNTPTATPTNTDTPTSTYTQAPTLTPNFTLTQKSKLQDTAVAAITATGQGTKNALDAATHAVVADGIIVMDNIRLMSGPSNEYGFIGGVKNTELVHISGYIGTWYRISTENHIQGWLPAYSVRLLDNNSRVFGPAEGDLIHKGRVSTFSSGVNVRDFVAEAVFRVPLDTNTATWDIGFSFRAGSTQEIRLAVQSLTNYPFWAADLVNNGEFTRLTSGWLGENELNRKPNSDNRLLLVVKEDMAYLLLNNAYVASVNIGQLTSPGNVNLIVEAYDEDQKSVGQVTHFREFTIWEAGGCTATVGSDVLQSFSTHALPRADTVFPGWFMDAKLTYPIENIFSDENGIRWYWIPRTHGVVTGSSSVTIPGSGTSNAIGTWAQEGDLIVQGACGYIHRQFP